MALATRVNPNHPLHARGTAPGPVGTPALTQRLGYPSVETNGHSLRLLPLPSTIGVYNMPLACVDVELSRDRANEQHVLNGYNHHRDELQQNNRFYFKLLTLILLGRSPRTAGDPIKTQKNSLSQNDDWRNRTSLIGLRRPVRPLSAAVICPECSL